MTKRARMSWFIRKIIGNKKASVSFFTMGDVKEPYGEV